MELFCKVARRSCYNANILAKIGLMLLYSSHLAGSALEMEREKNHEGRIKRFRERLRQMNIKRYKQR